MKKTITTIAIVLGMTIGAVAQQTGGGLFQRGYVSEETSTPRSGGILDLPSEHGSDSDYEMPLGSGIAVLVGLGAAYLVGKKRKEE